MTKFLSNEWFLAVAELNNQAGELHLPPALVNTIINLQLSDEQKLHVKAGKIAQGLDDKAVATVRMDYGVLQSLVKNKDMNAAFEAFMMGKIRIEGDMSALMNLQSTKPSPELKQLYKAILAQTEF